MQATETAQADSAKRVAGLLAAELDQAADRKEFGVIVRDISPLDLSTLTDAIARPGGARPERLRLAVIGEDEEVGHAVARHPSLAGFLSPDEETAVIWRNKGFWAQTLENSETA
jgi:hypothetical protein